MNASSEDGRDQADAKDFAGLTWAALEYARKVLCDSQELLKRVRESPPADENYGRDDPASNG